VALLLTEFIAFAACYGAIVGSAVAAMPWTKWGAGIGGGVWGIFVAIAEVMDARRKMPRMMPRYSKYVEGGVGLTVGIVQGIFFGIAAAAFIGPLVAGFVGVYSNRLIGNRKWPALHIFPGRVLSAAACGLAVQAFYLDSMKATDGLWYGVLWGLAAGLVFCLVALPLACLAIRSTAEETHV
jgi:hypothetical protein